MHIQTTETISRQILTEAKGYLDVGFTHSLNPYSGCAFACSYCYVRQMPIQQFKDIPWGEWLDIKINAAEIYRQQIVKLRAKGKPVNIFMSSATDPYQPAERQAEITRRLLEAMLDHPPDYLQIQTRSPLVARDMEILGQLSAKCDLLVSMTIETDREDVKRIFAPYAPGIGVRIQALRQLREYGIATQAALSPVLPFTPAFPEMLVEAVEHIWIDTLTIGDGAGGKRSQKLEMPRLFREHGFEQWYTNDIHVRVRSYFSKHFPADKVRISRDEAFLKSETKK
ncbi:SPL family radical SAM protein [Paenibacillus shenyangensis]|uniref:SPL family radical SAM protein n=1 Tax=Paenibacillus sp. A9 TaxID=1284352 RepID=UPI0003674DBE|nr:radical SAM protein [Paenibacillus sp. A9]